MSIERIKRLLEDGAFQKAIKTHDRQAIIHYLALYEVSRDELKEHQKKVCQTRSEKQKQNIDVLFIITAMLVIFSVGFGLGLGWDLTRCVRVGCVDSVLTKVRLDTNTTGLLREVHDELTDLFNLSGTFMIVAPPVCGILCLVIAICIDFCQASAQHDPILIELETLDAMASTTCIELCEHPGMTACVGEVIPTVVSQRTSPI